MKINRLICYTIYMNLIFHPVAHSDAGDKRLPQWRKRSVSRVMDSKVVRPEQRDVMPRNLTLMLRWFEAAGENTSSICLRLFKWNSWAMLPGRCEQPHDWGPKF